MTKAQPKIKQNSTRETTAQATLRQAILPIHVKDEGIACLFSQHTGQLDPVWLRHDYHKFIYVDGGFGELQTRTANFPLQPGAALLVPGSFEHCWHDDPEAPLRLIICCFTADALDQQVSEWISADIRSCQSPRAHQLAHEIAIETSLRPIGWAAQSKAALTSFFVHEMRHAALPSLSLSPNDGNGTTTTRNPAISHLIEQACSIISNKYQEKISINELAEQAEMSYRSFTCHFKALTGLTVVAYQRRVRIEASKRLLHSGWSVIDSALHVGYQDLGHFYRSFRQETQQTPKQYQNATSGFAEH